MRAELYTVVDQGGVVVDVAVENPLYGELRGNLNLASRYDVDHVPPAGGGYAGVPAEPDDRRRAPAHPPAARTPKPASAASRLLWLTRGCCTRKK